MANGWEINTDNIPYAYSKLAEAAQLPPDLSGQAVWDMLYEGTSLTDSIETSLKPWEEDPYYYLDIEDSDPFALDKAVYQSQTGAQVMTPFGPALEEAQAQVMLDAYSGAKELPMHTEEDCSSFMTEVDSFIDSSGGMIDEIVEAGEDLATRTGTLDRID